MSGGCVHLGMGLPASQLAPGAVRAHALRAALRMAWHGGNMGKGQWGPCIPEAWQPAPTTASTLDT